MHDQEFEEMIGYYRQQGAPQDQQMLIELLRETQQENGGVLSQAMLTRIAGAYGIKETMLQALIRRVPGLRCEAVPHRLEICGTCRSGAKLRDYIEKTYKVKSGSDNVEAGFSYHVTPCMKNCKNGPSVRWDGRLYGNANVELIRELIRELVK